MTTFDPPPAWKRESFDPNDVLVGARVRAPSDGAGIGLFGVPFDGAVTGRRGAAAGPDALRAELAVLKPFTFGRGEVTVDVADWGNVRVPADDVAAAHAAAAEATRAVLGAGRFPVALGGDHSITAPIAAAVREHRHARRLGVINLDAHLDIRETHDGRITSGTPFSRLLDAGVVEPENLVEVGARDFATSPHYGAKAEKLGIPVITAIEARQGGITEVMEDAVRRASRRTDGVYLSIDLDVLDHAHGPGVSAPTPGGLTSAELLEAIRAVARSGKLVGADVVELAPPYDVENRTARAGAYALMTLIAGLSEVVQ